LHLKLLWVVAGLAPIATLMAWLALRDNNGQTRGRRP
jgi:hypothetical protein